MNVIHIEDNPAHRRLFLSIANGFGWSVRTSTTGQECVNARFMDVVDVMFVDFELPDMTGEAVVRRIRSEERLRGLPPAPIAMLSGHDPNIWEPLCRNAGADAWINKPMAPAQILAVAAQITRQHDHSTTAQSTSAASRSLARAKPSAR